MRETFRRIRRDLKDRQNLDAYIVVLVSAVFAVLSIFGDFGSQNLRWSVLLAGVGLLVYRITMPSSRARGIEAYLGDRTSFEDEPLSDRLRHAKELWMYAPSGINFLSPVTCELIRTAILGRNDGIVRIVILNPNEEHAISLTARQLDDSVDFAVQRLRPSVTTTAVLLESMSKWCLSGSFEYRLLDYNPGFSLIVIDPGTRRGVAIVEFHGFHNESTSARMHLKLTKPDSERWYAYWVDQFDHIWASASPPISGGDR